EGTPGNPKTLPVTFSSVAGATSGQAIVGNIGAIADRVRVDPATGALLSVENLRITHTTTSDESFEDHTARIVGTHKVIANLDGTQGGTAYLGGWHGFTALHGLVTACQCVSDFEEHQHYVPPGGMSGGCDSSGPENGCWDGDVWGLAFSPQ